MQLLHEPQGRTERGSYQADAIHEFRRGTPTMGMFDTHATDLISRKSFGLERLHSSPVVRVITLKANIQEFQIFPMNVWVIE